MGLQHGGASFARLPVERMGEVQVRRSFIKDKNMSVVCPLRLPTLAGTPNRNIPVKRRVVVAMHYRHDTRTRTHLSLTWIY